MVTCTMENSMIINLMAKIVDIDGIVDNKLLDNSIMIDQ